MPAKKRIDLLVYVALAEEFASVRDAFTTKFIAEELSELPIIIYHGIIESYDGNVVSIVLLPAGKMGSTHSSAIISSVIDKLEPANIVVIGIAGSISEDLKPGDVFIPARVDEYLANSAVTGENQIEFKTSGNYYESDRRLLNRFINFSHRHPTVYDDWKQNCISRLKQIISEDQLRRLNFVGVSLENVRMIVGDDKVLASGPTVVKSNNFVKWLKIFDRKIAAVEMESAGVFEAAFSKIKKPRVLAIRPISDLADERKEKMEKITNGSIRSYCMTNAVLLLEKAIIYNLFQPEQKKNKPTQKDPLVRKVMVIGGTTGETIDPQSETNILNIYGYKIGEILANAGIELIACSPFSDSADYNIIYGFANAKKKGKIYMHYPSNPDVIDQLALFKRFLGNKCPEIKPYLHPSYPTPEARTFAWLLCQLQALEQADLVIAIGGKQSKSANMILHLAEIKKILVVPLLVLEGAAKQYYERTNWEKAFPHINIKKLSSIDGIRNLPAIIRQLKKDYTTQQNLQLNKGSRIFISRAREDTKIAANLSSRLSQYGLTVLLGDETINSERPIIPTIDDSLNSCQLIIIIWSRNYALSPWCFDELSLAVKREKDRLNAIIIFNIDGSSIVPSNARNLSTFFTYEVTDMADIVTKQLNGVETN